MVISGRLIVTHPYSLDAVPDTGAEIKWSWVNAEVERVVAGLRAELHQREIAQAVGQSLPRPVRAADNARLLHKVVTNDLKPREEIELCTQRLAKLAAFLAAQVRADIIGHACAHQCVGKYQ